MIRFLNLIALVAVIGSATWAYSVKYETILVAEKLKKRQTELSKERDAIAVMEAEWQLLNRPARLAALAKPEEGMGLLSARQVVQPRDIPAASAVKADPLDQLLTGSIPAPAPVKSAPAKTAPTKSAPAKTAPAKSATQTAPKTAPKTATATHAPLSLGPKAVAPKSSAPKSSAPKVNAPKAASAGAPVKLAPPPAPAPRADSGGLNALFKKIIP